jgi:putative ABC transport system ATP-binding protein
MQMMRRLNRERAITFVLVTHDIGIGRQADRIIRMRDGMIEGEDHNHPSQIEG